MGGSMTDGWLWLDYECAWVIHNRRTTSNWYQIKVVATDCTQPWLLEGLPSDYSPKIFVLRQWKRYAAAPLVAYIGDTDDGTYHIIIWSWGGGQSSIDEVPLAIVIKSISSAEDESVSADGQWSCAGRYPTRRRRIGAAQGHHDGTVCWW